MQFRKYHIGLSILMSTITFLGILNSSASAGTNVGPSGELEFGDYSVGYRRLGVIDLSRVNKEQFDYLGQSTGEEAFRRIPVDLWYPAVASDAPRMELADYIADRLDDSQSPSEDSNPRLNIFASQAMQNGASKDDIDSWIASKMKAIRGADNLGGRYPVVFVPGGYASTYMNAASAEFLASHGFVVAFVPDASIIGTLSYSGAASYQWRIDDARQVINSLGDLEFVDQTKIGIWAFHSGGGAAITLQMQNPNVRAVVSVEGSEGWKREDVGIKAIRQMPLFDTSRVTVPYLHFQSAVTTPDWYVSVPDKSTFEFYEEATFAERYLVTLENIGHDELLDYGVPSDVIPAYSPDATGNGRIGQRVVAEIGLRFLEANLKVDLKSTGGELANKLLEIANSELVSIEYLAASQRPPSKADVSKALKSGGKVALASLVADFPGSVTDALVADVALDVFWIDADPSTAIEYLSVALDVFPNSYLLADRLGFIFSRIGLREEMRSAYTLALSRVEASTSISDDQKSELRLRYRARLEE